MEKERCNLFLLPESRSGYDKLSVNGRRFSGTGLLGETFTAWTDLTWRSDESVVERGWQFCLISLTCAMDVEKIFASRFFAKTGHGNGRV